MIKDRLTSSTISQDRLPPKLLQQAVLRHWSAGADPRPDPGPGLHEGFASRVFCSTKDKQKREQHIVLPEFIMYCFLQKITLGLSWRALRPSSKENSHGGTSKPDWSLSASFGCLFFGLMRANQLYQTCWRFCLQPDDCGHTQENQGLSSIHFKFCSGFYRKPVESSYIFL